MLVYRKEPDTALVVRVLQSQVEGLAKSLPSTVRQYGWRGLVEELAIRGGVVGLAGLTAVIFPRTRYYEDSEPDRDGNGL